MTADKLTRRERKAQQNRERFGRIPEMTVAICSRALAILIYHGIIDRDTLKRASPARYFPPIQRQKE